MSKLKRKKIAVAESDPLLKNFAFCTLTFALELYPLAQTGYPVPHPLQPFPVPLLLLLLHAVVAFHRPI